MDAYPIRRLAVVTDAEVAGLAALLVDCVDGGASVGFMAPLLVATAERFWRKVGADVAGGVRAVLVAEDGEGIVGTVQLVLGLPDNQPHRADLVKMLVHSRARRRGLGGALLRAVEGTARDERRTVLVLDAVTGGDGERLYAAHGWQRVGVVPDYALMPYGGFCDTTFFHRALG